MHIIRNPAENSRLLCGDSVSAASLIITAWLLLGSKIFPWAVVGLQVVLAASILGLYSISDPAVILLAMPLGFHRAVRRRLVCQCRYAAADGLLFVDGLWWSGGVRLIGGIRWRRSSPGR